MYRPTQMLHLEVGDRDLSRSLRQQLLATVISTASQIQMENGSHSAALLIMYGTDRAARLRTTGGPSHVPEKPFGYVLGITHVSWWFTKHLYLAFHLQYHKMFDLSLSVAMVCPFSAWTYAIKIEATSQRKDTSMLVPTFSSRNLYMFNVETGAVGSRLDMESYFVSRATPFDQAGHLLSDVKEVNSGESPRR